MCCKICLFFKDFSIYKCLPNCFYTVRNKIGEKCPTIYCVLFDKLNKWRILRYTLGYIYGLFIAIIFWDVFIVDLGLSFGVTYNCLLILIVILGLGYALSVKLRCIVWLTCIGFLGKTGRSFLRAMTFALIIAGPIANLALNGKEVIRVFACSTILTYNLTKNRFDLMAKPFINAVVGMKENISEVKAAFSEVQNVVAPIIMEIEEDDVPDNATETNNLNSTVTESGNAEINNLNYTITDSGNITRIANVNTTNIDNTTLLIEITNTTANTTYLNSTNTGNVNPINVENSNITKRKRNADLNPKDGSAESAEIYQQRYISKMRSRCQSQLEKGENKCRGAFKKAYDNCYQKLPSVINVLLCWPMKITVVCNLELLGFNKGENGICDPSKVVDRDFGENYADLKMTEEKFVSNLSSTRVDYKLIEAENVPGVRAAEETGKVVMNQFSEKKSLFDKYMYFVRRILSFIFIKVIIGSMKYHKKYLKNIEFDNNYVTGYFKKIDLRRKNRGQNILLPLKKIESQAIVDPTESRKSKEESTALTAHILKLLIEIITALILLLLDYIVYVMMDIVAQNARIEYRQEGEHTVQVMVNGTGIIAALIRSTLRGFNISESISTVLTNEPCLPQPKKLSTWFYTKFFLLYFSVILLVCNETLILRMRRTICSYFYPKREKQRVLHLYNKLLKRRRALFKTMYRTVKERVLRDAYKIHLNILTIIRVRCPILFGWLRNFQFARRKCIICEEPEPKKYSKKRPYNFAKCKTWGCYAVHCEECWFEVGKICLACQKIPKSKKNAKPEEDFESDFGEF